MTERFGEKNEIKKEDAVNQQFSFFFSIFSILWKKTVRVLDFDLFVFCKYFQFRPA